MIKKKKIKKTRSQANIELHHLFNEFYRFQFFSKNGRTHFYSDCLCSQVKHFYTKEDFSQYVASRVNTLIPNHSDRFIQLRLASYYLLGQFSQWGNFLVSFFKRIFQSYKPGAILPRRGHPLDVLSLLHLTPYYPVTEILLLSSSLCVCQVSLPSIPNSNTVALGGYQPLIVLS